MLITKWFVAYNLYKCIWCRKCKTQIGWMNVHQRSEPSLSSWGWSIASKQQAKLFAEHCTFQLKKTITPSLVVKVLKHWRVQKISLPTEMSFLPFTIPLHISIPFIFPHIPCLLLCQALSTLHMFLLINPALNECIWVTLTLSHSAKQK